MSATLPSASIQEDIYTGFWVNYSLGAFHGTTLTISQQYGAILIAFIALYVGAAGRSLWKIVRFSLHMAFSSALAQDGVHHQRQAVLRNTSLAHDAALDLLRVYLAWRKRPGHLHKRLVPFVWLAAIVSATSIGLSTVSCDSSGLC